MLGGRVWQLIYTKLVVVYQNKIVKVTDSMIVYVLHTDVEDDDFFSFSYLAHVCYPTYSACNNYNQST